MRTSFKVAQERKEARKAEKVKAQALAVTTVEKAAEKAPKEQAGGYHIKQCPPPAGVPRGCPGGWMLAQAPRKYDADGNPIGAIEYSQCYVAP